MEEEDERWWLRNAERNVRLPSIGGVISGQKSRKKDIFLGNLHASSLNQRENFEKSYKPSMGRLFVSIKITSFSLNLYFRNNYKFQTRVVLLFTYSSVNVGKFYFWP